MTLKDFNRRIVSSASLALAILGVVFQSGSYASQPSINQDKVVVLTFDDAVKSHRTFVAPLLKKLGFGATFFVTHRWMDDPENFMSWQDIGEIHQMGFEIGNHTWTHADFSSPRTAARLAGELSLVENELQKVGVPRPVSFAYCGNGFGPEAVEKLDKLGFKFARRGMQPEVPYGRIEIGPTFDPLKHHRLLIPTTGDAYPDWTVEHFRKAIARARAGQIVVLQFHGVPDPKHPWVHTPQDRFREYMDYLKQQDIRVIAMRDLARYISNENRPADPLLKVRFPEPKNGVVNLPSEVETTRADLPYWLKNMLIHHRYSWDEIAQVTGHSLEQVEQRGRELVRAQISGARGDLFKEGETIRVLPYPGGRHPRIGFLEGAILPHRGTKASVFLPWNLASYVVVDLPEAIFSNLGLTYLAHTHVPTIWDARNIWLENIDWKRGSNGDLTGSRTLPNKISFGASIQPSRTQLEMELWLRNDSGETLKGLRAQVCVMLKGAPDFNSQTNENKILRSPVAAVRSLDNHWILAAWQRCGRVWGNPLCPCMHSDPLLPDCPPGETVRVRGRIWFYKGDQIETELESARREFASG